MGSIVELSNHYNLHVLLNSNVIHIVLGKKNSSKSRLIVTLSHIAVIQWLNKQVTDVQLNQHRPAAGPFEMNTTGSTVSASTGYRSHAPPMVVVWGPVMN